MQIIEVLFGSSGFQPHGFCYQWNPGLVWLNVLSDLLIGLAYFAIPVILVTFIRKRKDLPFSWMFGLFGLFIVACGSTHFMEVWNLWHARYWLAGMIKAVTAAASVPTAVLLARIVPQALELPSTRQWIELNAALREEVRDRREVEVNLRISEATYREAAELLEQQRAELARSNAELNATNLELEAFSYSVSHDLRAPLRSIDGFSLALQEDYSDKLDADGKKNLERVRAATERMGALIDDLLGLARVTQTSIQLESINISAVATDVAEKLKESHPERHVEVRVEQGLRATADAQLLRIALENLLGNAWKFSAKRNLAHIEFGKSRANGSTAYFVRDDGAGFDPAYAERLFGAFQRLHSASEFPGTGIGLATVQRIIHRHGGKIWAESSFGQGATFYFTLAEARR